MSLSNFVVDPGTSMLYGTVNGSTAKEPLLFLDGSKVKVTQGTDTVTLDGTEAELTQTAATALNGAFRDQSGESRAQARSRAPRRAGDPCGSFRGDGCHQPRPHRALDRAWLSTRPTLSALGSLGVTLSTIGTAKDENNVVTFPITGGFVGVHKNLSFQPGFILGSINHEASGVVFAGHGKSLTLRDFVVDPGNSMLSARCPMTRPAAPSCRCSSSTDRSSRFPRDSSGNVVLDGTVAELTSQAAAALNSTFGVKAFKAGMVLGTVHLVASTVTS